MLHWKTQLALLAVVFAALVATVGGLALDTAGFYW
jgi:hypothetical protein